MGTSDCRIGAAQHIQGGAPRTSYDIRPRRSGRGSSPCPTRRRSRARTSPARRRRRRPRPAREARSSSRRPGRRGWPSTCGRPSRGSGPRTPRAASDVGFHSVPMSRRFTKKSLVSVPGRVVNTPWPACPAVTFERAQAADEHGHLGRAQRQPERALDQQVLGGHVVAVAEVVAEAVGVRLEHGERLDVGLLLRRIGAAGRERHLHVVAAVLRGLLDGRASAENDQVGERDLLLRRRPARR